jgi:nicotinate-nucleotide pyrophosphorylase (carboxylating)
VVSHPEIFDGVRVHKGQVLAVIRHNAQVLLSCERVILNLMQHLSGIATLTRQYVDAIQGTKARVLDTRKTVPGLRALEKYAVLCGGGTNHRLDLSSGILIKNNHISLGGGLRTALTNALEKRKPGNRVQVEVRTQKELEEALECGGEAILLDNMSPAQVKSAVERIRKEERWIPIEASGGIVLENIRAYAEAGADFISVGALTHSAKAADISMSIVAEPA